MGGGGQFGALLPLLFGGFEISAQQRLALYRRVRQGIEEVVVGGRLAESVAVPRERILRRRPLRSGRPSRSGPPGPPTPTARPQRSTRRPRAARRTPRGCCAPRTPNVTYGSMETTPPASSPRARRTLTALSCSQRHTEASHAWCRFHLGLSPRPRSRSLSR